MTLQNEIKEVEERSSRSGKSGSPYRVKRTNWGVGRKMHQ